MQSSASKKKHCGTHLMEFDKALNPQGAFEEFCHLKMVQGIPFYSSSELLSGPSVKLGYALLGALGMIYISHMYLKLLMNFNTIKN